MQEERKGEIYMLLLSVIESWFPILSLFAIPLIGAMYSFALSIVIATIIFLALGLYQKKGHELFQKDARKDLLLTTFFINLLFILVFLGLQYTTAGNMAVIIFLQLLFAYLYFNVFGSDRLSPYATFVIRAFPCSQRPLLLLPTFIKSAHAAMSVQRLSSLLETLWPCLF
jgi:drug/metabolite transporter (DMT)-like permease